MMAGRAWTVREQGRRVEAEANLHALADVALHGLRAASRTVTPEKDAADAGECGHPETVVTAHVAAGCRCATTMTALLWGIAQLPVLPLLLLLRADGGVQWEWRLSCQSAAIRTPPRC